MRFCFASLLVGSVSSLGLATTPSAIGLAGAELSRDNHYTYVGAVLPLPGHSLGSGLVGRFWLDHIGYVYDASPASRVEGQSLGQEAALGWQWSGTHNWGGIYLGLRHSHLELEPDDPTNRDRGHRWRGKLQVEGDLAISPSWRANGIASHLFGSNNHWVRLRLQTALSNGWHTGPEVIRLSAPDHRAWQLGSYLGNLRLDQDLYLTFKAGVRKASGESVRGYIGAEFYRAF